MNMNRVVTSLLLRKPFYGYVLASLRWVPAPGLERIEAVYDGPTVRLLYDSEWLEERGENRVYGAVIHELLHIVLMHAFRRNGRARDLWALSCDLAVNEHIDSSLMMPESLTVGRLNREPGISLEYGRSAEYYYERLAGLADEEALDFTCGENEVIVHFPEEDSAPVRVERDAETSEVNTRTLQCTLEDLTRQAAREGEIPGTLRDNLNGLYRSLDVNWRSVLRKFLAGKGRMRVRKTVKRVSKRFDDLPGTQRTKGIQALAAIDESGSVADEDLETFSVELYRLERAVHADIHITRFDTDCTDPVPLRSFFRRRERAKQGGTDYRPIFELAESRGIPLVIVFTDGEGIYPREAGSKVLWIFTGDPPDPPPFGDVLRFTG